MRFFVISIIILSVFWGCGGGGSGSSTTGSAITTGKISGSIRIDEAVLSTHSIISSFTANIRFSDALVFLEEMPTVQARPDENGHFTFTNIPFGDYHVIARVPALSGNNYKVRTPVISLTQGTPEENTEIICSTKDIAKYQVRLQLKDDDKKAIRGAKIWLWGEEFTLDENAYYVSPLMPEGAIGTIKVIPPIESSSEKKLASTEFLTGISTFRDKHLGIIGVTLLPVGITTNRAPAVTISIDESANQGAYLRLTGTANDPDNDPLKFIWQTDISSFAFILDNEADWIIPEHLATASIWLEAREDGSRMPRLRTIAQVFIKVTPDGGVSFPGEIIIKPTIRTVNIVSTATAIIPSNVGIKYVAEPNFPTGSSITYRWEADNGTIISGSDTQELLWLSPNSDSEESILVNINVYASDGLATASNQIQVTVTSMPTVTITSQAIEPFEPGVIKFSGSAKDHLNNIIPPDRHTWSIATGTGKFVSYQIGGATTSWNFIAQGNYTLSLSATDDDGAIGSSSRDIYINNGRPVCRIISPADDTIIPANTSVTFNGIVIDHEDGSITDASALTWVSDIDGIIGSGIKATVSLLTSGIHTITLLASDSAKMLGSASITLWYDMPGRIVFTPPDKSVVFVGNDIPFSATGADSDNSVLDSSSFVWHLNNLSETWREGGSFVIPDGGLSHGLHLVHIEGAGKFGSIKSLSHSIQVGLPQIAISSPRLGIRFEPDTDITFTSTPPAPASLEMEWYMNGSSIPFGTGNTFVYRPTSGAYTATCIATDSVGGSSFASVNFVVERTPIVSFTPQSGSYIFGGRPIVFVADCKDSDNIPISGEKIRWYIDDKLRGTGKTISISQGNLPDLATGSHVIKVEATGPYGTVGSAIATINTGIDNPRIILPEDSTTVPPNTAISFKGHPDSTGTITMEWWVNYGKSDAILLDSGANITKNFLIKKNYTITYTGIDSTSFVSSHTINLIISDTPSVSFTPSSGSKIFTGKSFELTVAGDIKKDSVQWLLSTSSPGLPFDPPKKGSPATVFAKDFNAPGLYNITALGYNSFGALGSITNSIYYGVGSASITSPDSDTSFGSADKIELVGTPDSQDPITMSWYLDDISSAFATGKNATLNTTDGKLSIGSHIIRYEGKDSAGNISSATIQIIVNDPPTIVITPNDLSQRYFIGHETFNFDGSKSLASNKKPVEYTWTLNDINIKDTQNVNYMLAELNSVDTLNNLNLKIKDSLGNTASKIITFYHNYPLPVISAPVNNQRITKGDTVSLTGTPISTTLMPMAWLLDGAATTSPLSTPLARGWHEITYTGTDSADMNASYVIKILVNATPTISISTPSSDGKYFGGQSLTFVGTAHDDAGTAINIASLTWYKDTTSLENGNSITVLPIKIGTGTFQIAFNAIDEYGYIASKSVTIQTGIKNPKISTVPKARYDQGSPIIFNGSDMAGIRATWSSEIRGSTTASGSWTDGTLNTTGMRGWFTIKYSGIDSLLTTRSDSIDILINNLPEFTVLPKIDSPLKFATGPKHMDKNIPIYLAGGGQIAKFSVKAEDGSGKDISDTDLIWDTGGSPMYGQSPPDVRLQPGSYTYTVTATDEFDCKNTAGVTFWIWDTENYTANELSGDRALVKSILKLDDSSLFVIEEGKSLIVKLKRDTSDGLTTNGDLTIANSTSIASGADYIFIDLTYTSGNLYSVAKKRADSKYYVKTWNTQTMHSESIEYALTRIASVTGMTSDETGLYITDKTGGKLMKYDIKNGEFYSDKAITNPIGIKFDGNGKLLVVGNIFEDSSIGNKVFRLGDDLNTDSSWDATSQPSSSYNPQHLVYSPSSNNTYVTDTLASRIHVIASDGSLLYSFPDTEYTANNGHFDKPYGIAILGDDLYITDASDTLSKIVRFRSGDW